MISNRIPARKHRSATPRAGNSPPSEHEHHVNVLFDEFLHHAYAGELNGVRHTLTRLRVHGYVVQRLDDVGIRLVPVESTSIHA